MLVCVVLALIASCTCFSGMPGAQAPLSRDLRQESSMVQKKQPLGSDRPSRFVTRPGADGLRRNLWCTGLEQDEPSSITKGQRWR